MKWPPRKAAPKVDLSADTEAARTLLVSRVVLRRTHEYFLPYWSAGVETACFWFGADAGRLQVVTTVAVPKLYQTRGNYSVEMASLRCLAAEMRAMGLTNLAQIHTHPSDWVDHSQYDDERAYSTREGALSLVWPDYGSRLGHDLSGIGVLERRGAEWVRLSDAEAESRVRLVDDFADFRWEIKGGGIRNEE